MTDKFFFSGLDRSNWFAKHFEDYLLFGYVGDRQKLLEYERQRSVVRRIFEVFAPRISITSIIRKVAGVDLLQSTGGESTAKKLIDLFNERDKSRTLSQFWSTLDRNRRKRGRYFDGIFENFKNKTPLCEAVFNDIAGTLVIVEGQLVHRSAVAQYSRTSASSLSASSVEWIMSDFPPFGMVQHNPGFAGHLLLLKDDPGFSKAFDGFLPFCRDIGWYPYCRIAGFFDPTKISTEVYPSLSISLVQYRRPKLFQEIKASLTSFLEQELANPNYLKEWSDRLLAGYLLPIICRGSHVKPSDALPVLKPLLGRYKAAVGSDLPNALATWYK